MKAIFFDWDGTLVDSIPLLFSAHNYTREKMGHAPWTKEEYRAAMVSSTREIYPVLYGDKAQEAQDILYAFILENHLKHLEVLEGARELIEFLGARNAPMGIVSNKRHDVLRREVEHLGWQKYFGVYNGAGVAAKDKPSGAPLLFALNQFPHKVDIKDVLYVGDTESDLGCARDAGCEAVYIRQELFKPELVKQYKPAYVVDDLAALKNVLINYLEMQS
jgi:phosphoglycolate phosphatase